MLLDLRSIHIFVEKCLWKKYIVTIIDILHLFIVDLNGWTIYPNAWYLVVCVHRIQWPFLEWYLISYTASECTKCHLNILKVECHVYKSHKDNFYAQNMRTGQEMFTFFSNWPHSFMSQAWTQLVLCHRRQSTAQLWNNIIQYNTKLYFTQIT